MGTLMANIFLICFLTGTILVIISLLFGGDSGHAHFHFGGHDGGLHIGGHDGPHIGGHDAGGGAGHASPQGGPQISVPFFSYNGILMFMAFFGGVGYILSRHSSAPVLIALLGAIGAGFAGAATVFYMLSGFLLKGQTIMNPADYYLPGTLARVTSSIREGGTGEIMYVQGGTRKTAGARSEDTIGHKQGEEVLVVRYEKGIAYVKAMPEELKVGLEG